MSSTIYSSIDLVTLTTFSKVIFKLFPLNFNSYNYFFYFIIVCVRSSCNFYYVVLKKPPGVLVVYKLLKDLTESKVIY